MKKLLFLLLLVAGVIYLFFNSFQFEPTSHHAFPAQAATPVPEERIPFKNVAKGVSNYLRGVEFSIKDKVPEEIALEDLDLYEKALLASKGLRENPEISSTLRLVFAEVRKLRSKLINSTSKLQKLALMKKGLMDTDESFKRRVELRRYNLENEIRRETDIVFARFKKLQNQVDRMAVSNSTLTLPKSDPLVSALGSTVHGPASRGYPPPLNEAPTPGELKVCEAQVISVTREGTIAAEIEFVTGPVDSLRRIGGGAGHVPVIAVPGSRLLYFEGLKDGVIEDQRIKVLARRTGIYRYTVRNGSQRSAEHWIFIRFENR